MHLIYIDNLWDKICCWRDNQQSDFVKRFQSSSVTYSRTYYELSEGMKSGWTGTHPTSETRRKEISGKFPSSTSVKRGADDGRTC
jgi:hypothetical protein